MKNVIFLDIDGVLNSDDYIDSIKHLELKPENEIDKEKLKLLIPAIKLTESKVVLTASGRYGKVGKYLISILSQFGIQTDVTPYIDSERGKEIRAWLNQNKGIDDFVILDDEIFKSYDCEMLSKLIKISDGNGGSLGKGILPKDIEEIVKRLKKQKEIEMYSEYDER